MPPLTALRRAASAGFSPARLRHARLSQSAEHHRRFCSPSPAAPAHHLPPSPSPQLRQALRDMSQLPEAKQAAATVDAQLRHTLLTRVLQISASVAAASPSPGTPPAIPRAASLTSPSPEHYTIAARVLLARHANSIGDVTAERDHRIRILQSLNALHPDDRDSATPAHLALALACLRAPGAEARLAASAAAANAHRNAECHASRLTASLLTALATPPASRPILLSALVAVDATPDAVNNAHSPDIPGFARYFLARTPPPSNSGEQVDDGATPDGESERPGGAVDHARALVVRWQDRGFDAVEALCQAAHTLREHVGRGALAEASGYAEKALQLSESLGNQLDKAEPLLALARIAQQRGDMVEAEGLFRAVEAAFKPLWEKQAFTVASAELFVRAMTAHAAFLADLSVNGQSRAKEGGPLLEKAETVRMLFEQVLRKDEEPGIPPWVADSLLPHFELPVPIEG